MEQQKQPALALSKTEWQVVALGLRDATTLGWDQTLTQDGLRARLANLFRVLAGSRSGKPLANPKLEALRQFVSATRRHHKPARQLAPTLLAHGYGQADVENLGLLAA